MANLFGKRSDTKLWGTSTSQTFGEINLRSEIKDLLNGTTGVPQKGHWIVYRRHDLTAPSEFWDEVYRSGVGGPAYQFVDVVMISRRDPQFSAEANEASTDPGILVGGKYIYYFEHNIVPSTKDQLFEINWDNHKVKPRLSQIPTPYVEKFNIKEVFPARGDSGRIEYWYCLVNTDKINY